MRVVQTLRSSSTPCQESELAKPVLGFPRQLCALPATADLLVARVVANEVARTEIAESLLDLGASVHYERSVASDRLAERAGRGQQESPACAAGFRLDEVAVAEDDQRWSHGRRVIGSEADLSLIHVREGRVPARYRVAERRARR